MSHVFISYSTRNGNYARKLADKLRAEGFDVWIDNSQLRSSQDWWRSIVLAIRGCSAVVVVLTPESDASEWVQREITLAGKYKKPIFPLWLDGTLDTPNWEYFVRIQVEDVRGGKLPPTHVCDTLALHAPRRERPGVNVTEQPPIILPEVTDQEFERDIANPPKPTPTLPKLPRVGNRRNLGILAGAAVVLVAVIVIVLAAVNQPGTSTITANDQWTPVTQTFDGVDMVLVPKGCFDMGSTTSSGDQQPVSQVCFDTPFWIDRTEVTNAQYGSSGAFSGEDRPREDVNWSDAKAFCENRGARLPTEAEWEYAARGPSNWVYPWGNDFVGDNVVYNDSSVNQTVPVGSKPGGVSWVGALDMSGNVWEWVSTIYDQDQFPYPYRPDDGREDVNRTDVPRVVRGGSWNFGVDGVRAADRYFYLPTDVSHNVGFRCVRDY